MGGLNLHGLGVLRQGCLLPQMSRTVHTHHCRRPAGLEVCGAKIPASTCALSMRPLMQACLLMVVENRLCLLGQEGPALCSAVGFSCRPMAALPARAEEAGSHPLGRHMRFIVVVERLEGPSRCGPQRQISSREQHVHVCVRVGCFAYYTACRGVSVIVGAAQLLRCTCVDGVAHVGCHALATL